MKRDDKIPLKDSRIGQVLFYSLVAATGGIMVGMVFWECVFNWLKSILL